MMHVRVVCQSGFRVNLNSHSRETNFGKQYSDIQSVGDERPNALSLLTAHLSDEIYSLKTTEHFVKMEIGLYSSISARMHRPQSVPVNLYKLMESCEMANHTQSGKRDWRKCHCFSHRIKCPVLCETLHVSMHSGAQFIYLIQFIFGARYKHSPASCVIMSLHQWTTTRERERKINNNNNSNR